MPAKRHIYLFLVFFISCSTSIRDQIGQKLTNDPVTLDISVPIQPLLAETKAQPYGCWPAAGQQGPGLPVD
jgi:hypothetical protein